MWIAIAILSGLGGWAQANPIYRVIITPSNEATLSQAQQWVEDAYLSEFQGGLILIAGSFSSRQLAERHVQRLQGYGLSAAVLDDAAPPAESTATPQPPAALPAAVPPTTPRSERPFATIIAIPPGRDADAWLQEVQRLFPTASLSPAGIQIGQFSQQAQAQIQANWLEQRGYSVQVIEQASLPATPPASVTTTAAADSSAEAAQVWVLVADPLGDREAELKRLIPEAAALSYRDLRVVRTGSFSSETEANEQIRFLASQGIEAGIFPALDAATPASEMGATFRVLVPYSDTALQQVLSLSPDAFARDWEGRRVIQFATYARARNAEAAVSRLAELGLRAEVVRDEP